MNLVARLKEESCLDPFRGRGENGCDGIGNDLNWGAEIRWIKRLKMRLM